MVVVVFGVPKKARNGLKMITYGWEVGYEDCLSLASKKILLLCLGHELSSVKSSGVG